MSAKVLIHGRHTVKEVCDAVARAWPDLLFLIYRPKQGDVEESLLAPHEKLHPSSNNAVTLEGVMTGREVNHILRDAFGLAVEISVESGKSCMNTALDQAR